MLNLNIGEPNKEEEQAFDEWVARVRQISPAHPNYCPLYEMFCDGDTPEQAANWLEQALTDEAIGY